MPFCSEGAHKITKKKEKYASPDCSIINQIIK